jgi:hypothetical protein
LAPAELCASEMPRAPRRYDRQGRLYADARFIPLWCPHHR